MRKMIFVIIPSYEPDERLISLLNALDSNKVGSVIIVDDGSGEQYSGVFEQAEAIIKKNGGTLLVHEINRGKGRALKTAFQYILDKFPDAIGVVTADSDGQHTVEGIKSVMNALKCSPNTLILGVRDFSGDAIPWKSRLGNYITEKVFTYVAGFHISDTQTGLRGIPMKFMEELLNVSGERFEFETQMLLESVGKYPVTEVSIETVYDSVERHKTHFNPVTDSIRIYQILGNKFFKYLFSSFSACGIDLLLFIIFSFFMKKNYTSYIVIATMLARVISAAYNYFMNYKVVFHSEENINRAGIKYFLLALAQMCVSAVLVSYGVILLPFVLEVAIKVIVDTALFFVSYYIQQKYIFKK